MKELRRVRKAFCSALLGWGVSEREKGETKESSEKCADCVEGPLRSPACLEQKGQRQGWTAENKQGWSERS